MQLAEILQQSAIKTLGGCSSKKRLFHELGVLAEQTYSVPASDVTEALIEREGLGPTGVGHGIALPHARLNQVEAVRGVFLRLEKPLNFDSIDRQPVDLVFALLAPSEAGVDHLKALALVSRTLRNPDVCAKLRANVEPATLHMILTEATASQAA
ncbi:PTS system, nitrogen regulatory IIA component [Loktanella sp. DSM 29012]|uniref:PTS sugar transporter subunit IIA n=1 Tax=Loktanella gaetbuli TaxID=2881335 RepID=A0ABS8BU92_9RHOB|nr:MULTISPECIES: PTS sugar transporter subunit IIA [Loktanella]KQI70029.1 PTS lactose transporter subunit IIC [Loktanella sp. 3ANDIMAR09]MCB5199271.1 PTS sugar transporter subunit IIA [Loktanella gaetbuli]SEP58978.1 PTS system, nitrogen regulatory IIA component [Loktanella sp. DSM 29012]